MPNSPGSPDERTFALTFDDGPGPFTRRIIEALASVDSKATFFVVGNRVNETPALVSELVSRGHTVGGHSWSHSRSDELTDDEILEEHTRTASLLHEVTGNRHTHIRPPYGIHNQRLATLLDAHGFTTVTWSVDPRDWSGISAVDIVTSVLSDLHPGAIVILHDGGEDRNSTVEAVPLIVEGARLMGYSEVPL